MKVPSLEIQAALQLIDEGFDRPAWHGPNLMGSLRGLTLAELLFRPSKDAHNAWELALHAAYWKHIIRQRIDPSATSPFGLPGSNFFTRNKGATLAEWKTDRALLKASHARLKSTIQGLTVKDLNAKLPASRHTYRRSLFGIAAHDIYHAGQIGLLKKLARA